MEYGRGARIGGIKEGKRRLGCYYLLERDGHDLPKVTQGVDKKTKTKNDISGSNSSYSSLLHG